jgi:hypothetical protein
VDQVVVEGLLMVVAGRVYVGSRTPALARTRRGSADLPDRDAPERTHTPDEVVVPSARGADGRWLRPASFGLAAVVGTVLARAAVLVL